jgi:hypothetical protein
MKQAPVPGDGCFKASYPSTQWQEVQCEEPPAYRSALPKIANRDQVVGNAYDYVAQAPAGHLFSSVVGSFPSVAGVTTENGVGGIPGPNEYTLQVNTNFYHSAACGGYSSCIAWQQYVMSTNTPVSLTSGSLTNETEVFIEYWLIDYGSSNSSACPSGFIIAEVDYPGVDCVQNTPATFIANGQLSITDLASLTLSGSATANGTDAATVTFDGEAYTATVNDSYTDIASGWNQAEFNVFGNAGGSEAVFNSGSSMIVSLAVTDGSTAAPTCVPPSNYDGTTGETNNLNLSSTCYSNGGSTPNIQFLESYAPPASHAGMTWITHGGSPIVHVGADSVTNPYNGDTAATVSLPLLCLDVTGAALPGLAGELTPDFYDGWVEGNLQLTVPISGTLLTSRAVADAYCAANFGAGWRMAEFHDGWYGTNLTTASAWHFWGNALGLFPASQRFWVAINDQIANPWNAINGGLATHAGMTWSVLGGSPIVHVGADSITNAYNGDTSASTILPILCIDVTGAALPGELTPDFYGGWVKGNLQLSAPISGTLLNSRAVANEYCALNFGSGWAMAEFHEGWYGPNLAYSGAWHFWGNAIGLFPAGQRFWVAISDQVANPWGE